LTYEGKVTGEWRKLHNEELNDMYCTPNIVQLIESRNEMGGACSAYGGKGEGYGGETCGKETTWDTQA